jgi:hypothetical protein
MALEGSKRLMAACELGLAPRLVVLGPDQLVDGATLDLFGVGAAESHPAEAIAALAKSHHNPEMEINSDGTLSLVTRPNLEEP